jgi:hypothetical protein
MDDLAPAALLRTPDEGGRTPDNVYPARRKLPKKVPPPPAKEPNPESAQRIPNINLTFWRDDET